MYCGMMFQWSTTDWVRASVSLGKRTFLPLTGIGKGQSWYKVDKVLGGIMGTWTRRQALSPSYTKEVSTWKRWAGAVMSSLSVSAAAVFSWLKRF
jgi:hypothetical protein